MSEKWWAICVACTAIFYTIIGLGLHGIIFKPKTIYPVQKFQLVFDGVLIKEYTTTTGESLRIDLDLKDVEGMIKLKLDRYEVGHQWLGSNYQAGKAKDIVMPTMTRQIFMSDPYFRQFVTDKKDGEK